MGDRQFRRLFLKTRFAGSWAKGERTALQWLTVDIGNRFVHGTIIIVITRIAQPCDGILFCLANRKDDAFVPVV